MPEISVIIPTYNRAQFGKDLASGITVGVLALPLAMAFAIASGASPTAGIWTAIVAGFITSAFGGSRVQIGGPTCAFIPIVYGIVAMHGFANLMGATILAGVFLLAMGIARMGQLIRFIPVTVVIGFTNGIAVLIALSQVKDWLGLSIDKMPGNFFSQVHVLGQHIGTLNPYALGLGGLWTGRLADRHGLMPVLCVGAVGVFGGFVWAGCRAAFGALVWRTG